MFFVVVAQVDDTVSEMIAQVRSSRRKKAMEKNKYCSCFSIIFSLIFESKDSKE